MMVEETKAQRSEKILSKVTQLVGGKVETSAQIWGFEAIELSRIGGSWLAVGSM